MRHLGAGSAGLGDWLEVSGENPLPHSIAPLSSYSVTPACFLCFPVHSEQSPEFSVRRLLSPTPASQKG